MSDRAVEQRRRLLLSEYVRHGRDDQGPLAIWRDIPTGRVKREQSEIRVIARGVIVPGTDDLARRKRR
jgi:hypothetical protein